MLLFSRDVSLLGLPHADAAACFFEPRSKARLKRELSVRGTTNQPLKEPLSCSNPHSTKTSATSNNTPWITSSLLVKAYRLLRDGFRGPWSLVYGQLISFTFATRADGSLEIVIDLIMDNQCRLERKSNIVSRLSIFLLS